MPNAITSATATGLPSRRATLAALTGLGAALSLPKAAHAAVAADPIPQLYAKAQVLRAYVNGEGVERPSWTDEQLNFHCDRIDDLESQAAATVPTTVAGALAALEWAAYEVAEAREWGDRRDGFIGDMLARVADFLRQEGGAA